MGDLIGKKKSSITRLVGADPITSKETNLVKVTTKNEVLTSDTPQTSGTSGNINIGTTTIELKVGSNKLPNRKIISIQPKGKKVFFGYDSSVTIATGTQVFKNQTLFIPIGADQSIWLISDNSSGVDVRITES